MYTSHVSITLLLLASSGIARAERISCKTEGSYPRVVTIEHDAGKSPLLLDAQGNANASRSGSVSLDRNTNGYVYRFKVYVRCGGAQIGHETGHDFADFIYYSDCDDARYFDTISFSSDLSEAIFEEQRQTRSHAAYFKITIPGLWFNDYVVKEKLNCSIQ